MTTLKDLKKRLEEAQENVASLEKEIEQRTPSIVTTVQFETFDGDRVVDALRKWASKYPIRARVTPDMLRSLADVMEENV